MLVVVGIGWILEGGKYDRNEEVEDILTEHSVSIREDRTVHAELVGSMTPHKASQHRTLILAIHTREHGRIAAAG